MAAHNAGFRGSYLVPEIPFVTDTLTYIGINLKSIKYDDGGDFIWNACACSAKSAAMTW